MLTAITDSGPAELAQSREVSMGKDDFLKLLVAQLENQVKSIGSPAAVRKAVRTVTPIPSQARQARAVTSSALKGLVSEVGQSLVTISLGNADGVTRNTVFHITRGEDFICNVKITNVDVNKSAGVVELEMASPRVGDTASTKL